MPVPAAHSVRQILYVDVPASPYPIYNKSHILKENTPLRPANTDTSTLKRKLSERETVPLKADPKKLKVGDVPEINNACPEFPHGFIYCHQCSKKRDALTSILCTHVYETSLKGVERRCNVKFCAPCLKRRYDEDVCEIKALGTDEIGTIVTYKFKCPKCRGICNCSRCRKSKGLEPTGSLKTPCVPTPACVVPNPKSNTSHSKATEAKSSLKSQKMQVEVLISTTPPVKKAPTAKIPLNLKAQPKPTVAGPSTNPVAPVLKQKQLPQPLPVLKWTAVSTYLDQEAAETRFQIREFVLRFASVMDPAIPKAQLAELDFLGSGDEGEDLIPWVSDGCARAMILGLLGLLADKDDETTKHVLIAICEIRATGNNLNKIWAILAHMREAFDADSALSFPDPLPAPSSATIRVTRSARESISGSPTIAVAYSAQMIPIINALVEAAFETPVVREELENGVKEGKELARVVKEGLKAENERWDTQRKALEAAASQTKGDETEKANSKIPIEIKSARQVHKQRVQSLENALKLLSPSFVTRFSPLGTDKAGRKFWTLSPGASERKAALDFIEATTSGSQNTKKSARQRGRPPASDEVFPATKEWPWFVAVWGKKIPVDSKGKGKTEVAGVDKDAQIADIEQWWGFYEPVDIRKVADWIRIDAGIDPFEDTNTTRPLATLVRGLNKYAALLEWRRKEDKYGSLAGAE
ncbi:hypothetical protein H0H81_006709 [Sphagnurus paluster]|uniref:Zinc-finger domain-containing protein n=1 Tax=Sphagnurus paluster TaxID=117069 RepID=A0A9P7K7P9_9AGAR|nr:hypothetical protein H0H81_006709 [Sphagnurus paluster]